MPYSDDEEQGEPKPPQEPEVEADMHVGVEEVMTPPQPNPQPASTEATLRRMFMRQDRLHRDLDLYWRGESTSHPDYHGPLDFNILEQGMVDLSIAHDAGFASSYGGDGDGNDPME